MIKSLLKALFSNFCTSYTPIIEDNIYTPFKSFDETMKELGFDIGDYRSLFKPKQHKNKDTFLKNGWCLFYCLHKDKVKSIGIFVYMFAVVVVIEVECRNKVIMWFFVRCRICRFFFVVVHLGAQRFNCFATIK